MHADLPKLVHSLLTGKVSKEEVIATLQDVVGTVESGSDRAEAQAYLDVLSNSATVQVAGNAALFEEAVLDDLIGWF